MQESIGHIIWSTCYLSVLIGLSAYGIHRYFIIYLYLKNRKRPPVPARYFEKLPKVTVQLPIFNEMYVAERLLRSVSELDYPQELLQIQVLDDSTDETREITAACAEELRQRGFNVQRIHRTDRTGFKAGALAGGTRCCGRRISLHPRRRFCSGKRPAQTHRPFLYRSKSWNDSNAVGAFEPRLFAAHTHAGDLFGWTSFA